MGMVFSVFDDHAIKIGGITGEEIANPSLQPKKRDCRNK
jgi:hypothetical protein